MSSTPRASPLANIERKTVWDLIAQGKRSGERSLTEYREMTIMPGIIEKANGSAEVHLGKTKVMVGVKIETGEPFPDTPDDGILTVSAELVPLAYPLFEPGPPDENSIELARVVDRGLRESKMIDLRKLCIQAGKKVFVIFVDIYILDHDGNLIDASAVASTTAVLGAMMNDYEVKEGELVWKPGKIRLPIRSFPVTVTLGKVGDSLVVDPSLEEEQVMSARITTAIDEKGHICAMQKGGLGVLSVEETRIAVAIARERAGQIRKKVLEVVG